MSLMSAMWSAHDTAYRIYGRRTQAVNSLLENLWNSMWKEHILNLIMHIMLKFGGGGREVGDEGIILLSL
jgi:hypothetical protein